MEGEQGDIINPTAERAKAGRAKLSRQQLFRAIALARAKMLYNQTRGTESAEAAGPVDPLDVGLGPPDRPVEGRHYGPENFERMQRRMDIQAPFMEGVEDIQTPSGGRINLPPVAPDQRFQDWEAILRILSTG